MTSQTISDSIFDQELPSVVLPVVNQFTFQMVGGRIKFTNIQVEGENKRKALELSEEITLRVDIDKLLIFDHEKITCIKQNNVFDYQFQFSDLQKIKDENILAKI